ncbi:entericidin A/B family lipoprotein [Legionella saoudiensis]|nr:entericidin A/B family lipoprotein [Legionella saoudiensis]
MNRAKKIIMVCVFLTTVGMLTACGTVNGFGRDVSHVGHGIQRASHL